MNGQLPYRRVLLKLSGEFLKGDREYGIDPAALHFAVEEIGTAAALGIELALVIGAGNIFRGLSAGAELGMSRNGADAMGMLATIMNSLALRDALEAAGHPAEVLSAIPLAGVAEAFDARRVDALLAARQIVILAGGTGHPFFTTDTTAALRACEIGADAVLKGTQVDGVYSADPRSDPHAERYVRISFAEALARKLRVMDATAFSLCMDNGIPIVVFRFRDAGMLERILRGDLGAATLVDGAGADAK